MLALSRRRNWTSTSVSRLRQLTETTLASGHCRAEESELRSEDVFRAIDGMKFMFQMAYLFPTMTGDNADDNADSGKKKSKFKRPAAKS